MAFCTQCGTELRTDEVHTCLAKQQSVAVPVASTASAATVSTPAPSAAPMLNNAREQLSKVDKHKILNLLKNPMSALQLRGDSDLLYGIMGIAVSLIGFVLWAWAFKHQLIKAMIGQLSSMFGGADQYDQTYRSASDSMSIVGHSLILSIVSTLVLLVAVFFIGNKLGTQRLHWKDALVKLGGLQLVTGAALLITTLLMLVTMKFSFVLLFTVLTASLMLTLYAGIEMFRLSRERAVWFIGSTVLIQIVAILLVFNSFGNEMVSSLRDMF
ncbi:hypothetical protein [Paenibacillus kandeliae]|uniref:hypothetical protein n=1 Tax=Paenibacillus kandeliae TaxID=3231269 RepID=UPI00345AE9CF